MPRQKKEKLCCIVCGKTDNLRHIEAGHGTLHICQDFECFKALLWKAEEAIPILWVSADEFREREILNKEEQKTLANLPTEAVSQVGNSMADSLWDDYFGERFSDILVVGASEIEYQKIKHTPKKDLPLMIGHLRFKNHQSFLEERMRS